MKHFSAPLILAGLLGSAGSVSAAVSYITAGSAYTQNFDSLSNTSWTNDSTLSGWHLYGNNPTPNAITTIGVRSDGTTSATGSFYSVKSASPSTDYALGSVGTSSATYYGTASTALSSNDTTISTTAATGLNGYIALQIANGTGSTLQNFTINWTGEQWRSGDNLAAVQYMNFQYGFGNAMTDVTTWTSNPTNDFRFASPINTNGAGTTNLDGNAPANRVTDLGGTVSGLSWANGTNLWVRWIESNNNGNDHLLAIDDVSFTAAVPEPSAALLAFLGALALLRRRR